MVPSSVVSEIYTIRGRTMNSSVWPSATAATISEVSLPSGVSTAQTLWPVASMAPASWRLMWAV